MSHNSQSEENENESESEEEKELTILQDEKKELIDEIKDLEKKIKKTQNDEKKSELQLRLKIARLEFKINGYEIELENTADATKRDNIRDQIKTKETSIHDLRLELQQLRQQSSKYFLFNDCKLICPFYISILF